ncbi:MAG: hypothetical protein ABIH18_02115 [Candidatus Omnitrophota bacterium]
MVDRKYAFDEPDREGFERLLQESFIYYKGMLILKGSFRLSQVDELLKTHTPKQQIQNLLNHIHMFFYHKDAKVQQVWVQELKQSWINRFKSEFPNLNVHIEDILTDPNDIIVSFWVINQKDVVDK